MGVLLFYEKCTNIDKFNIFCYTTSILLNEVNSSSLLLNKEDSDVMVNLGKLLVEARVEGATAHEEASVGSTRADLKRFSLVAERPLSSPTEESAMGRLPAEFKELGDVTNGNEFISTTITIVDQMMRHGLGSEITIHTVYGIVQLVHARKRELRGGADFKVAIARLNAAKTATNPKNPARTFLEALRSQ